MQSDSGFGEDSSWLAAGDDDLRHYLHQSSVVSNNSGGEENLDRRRLLKDLVEMVPLLEHYMEQKERSSFKPRGSMVYTKMPSRESLSVMGRNASQVVPGRKKRDTIEDGAEKEELTKLRELVNDLHTRLSEKEEVLSSMEVSKNQVNEMQGKLEDTKRLVAEKDMLIKSMQLQLTDTKIKLADKQAALEKTQWEAKSTGTRATKLQEQLNVVEGEISSFARVFESLAKTVSEKRYMDYDATPYEFDHIPYLDNVDEIVPMKMEEARVAYVAALTIAKEREDEESLAIVANARAYLQSLVFKY